MDAIQLRKFLFHCQRTFDFQNVLLSALQLLRNKSRQSLILLKVYILHFYQAMENVSQNVRGVMQN